MRKREYAEAVERCIPQTPPVFHQAMRQTLDAIAAQAPAGEKAAKARPVLSGVARWRLRWRRCCSSPPRRWPRPIGTSLTP